VHDGNRYFERCYGADFDPALSTRQKEACWQAWIAHYTRHQPAHRVDYALRRVEAFQNGEPPPGLPGLSPWARAPADDAKLASLVHYAPYATGGDGDGGPIPNGCLEACNTFEANCSAACPDDNVSCRNGCIRERSICLGGCH
jgi:hypothetical protein